MCGHAGLFGFREALESTLIDYLPFRLCIFASFISRALSPSRTGLTRLLFAYLISPPVCFVS